MNAPRATGGTPIASDRIWRPGGAQAEHKAESPCILWMMIYGCHAPPVKVAPSMVTQFSEQNGGAEVGRVVAMDAKSNSVAFLKALEQGAPPARLGNRFAQSLLVGKRIFNRANIVPTATTIDLDRFHPRQPEVLSVIANPALCVRHSDPSAWRLVWYRHVQ